MIKKLNNLFSSGKSDAQKKISELYNQYRSEFIAFIFKNYSNIDEKTIDGIYHDSFLVLYQNILSGKLTQLNSSLKTYLFGIGIKKTMKYLKTQSIEQTKIQQIDYIDFPDNIDTDDDWKQKQEIARQEVTQMSSFCKQVLSLYYWRKKSMQEIAIEMNYKNEQNAKNRKYLCLKTLKKILEQRFVNEGLD